MRLAAKDKTIDIGIDFGTSNSAVAALRAALQVIVPSVESMNIGGKEFPGYVALTADGQVLVGEPAGCQTAMRYPCLALLLITLLLASCSAPASHAESDTRQSPPAILKVDPALLCNVDRGC